MDELAPKASGTMPEDSKAMEQGIDAEGGECGSGVCVTVSGLGRVMVHLAWMYRFNLCETRVHVDLEGRGIYNTSQIRLLPRNSWVREIIHACYLCYTNGHDKQKIFFVSFLLHLPNKVASPLKGVPNSPFKFHFLRATNMLWPVCSSHYLVADRLETSCFL